MILTELIQAVSKALYKKTAIPCYVESSKDSTITPSFYIGLLDVTRESWLDVRFNYHIPLIITLYENANNPYTNQQTHDIALQALETLKLIQLANGSYVRTDDLAYRKNTGSPLVINVTYDIPMTEQQIKDVYMQNLIQKGKIPQ